MESMDRLYGINLDTLPNEINENDYCEPLKESCSAWIISSPLSPLNLQSLSSIQALDLATDITNYNSIDQLRFHACSVQQNSVQSQCRLVFLTNSEESTKTTSNLQDFGRETRGMESSYLVLNPNATTKSKPMNKNSELRPLFIDNDPRRLEAKVGVPIKERRNFALVEVDLKNLVEECSCIEKYTNVEDRLVLEATHLVSPDNDPQKAFELSILAFLPLLLSSSAFL